MTFRPMLSANVDLSILEYPVYGSAKLDGIRCLVRDGQAVTRKLKSVPNRHIRDLLSRPEYEGLDGELIVGSPVAEDCYRVTESAVMTRSGEPEFHFYVFDTFINPMLSFEKRFGIYIRRSPQSEQIRPLWQTFIETEEQLIVYEKKMVESGFEGIMIRRWNGLYKYGRSTVRQQWLLKWKRWSDSEAIILHKNELLKNGNDLEKDERGYAKRSSHKAQMIPMNTLGGLRVRDIHNGWEFDIGSGFTQELRDQLWAMKLKGKILKYKYVPVGMKDVPRWPIFLGFRSKIDL